MPFRIGPTELIIILVIVMLIFGVGKLSGVGSAIGRAIHDFRKAQAGEPLTGEEKGETQNPANTQTKTGS